MQTSAITRAPSPPYDDQKKTSLSPMQFQLEQIRERARTQPSPPPPESSVCLGIATLCCPVVLTVVSIWAAMKVKGH